MLFFEVWLGHEQCRETQPKNAKCLIILRQTHAELTKYKMQHSMIVLKYIYIYIYIYTYIFIWYGTLAVIKMEDFCQRGLGSVRYGLFALPNMLRFDSRYQQESIDGHHIPKRVCSARGFNIIINTPIFFFSKKKKDGRFLFYVNLLWAIDSKGVPRCSAKKASLTMIWKKSVKV